eukprot:881825-Amphidinium_carterae.2
MDTPRVKRETQTTLRADPEESRGLSRSAPTHRQQGVETSGWGGSQHVSDTHNLGKSQQPPVVKESGLGVPAPQPPWWWPNAVGEERTNVHPQEGLGLGLISPRERR